MAAPKPTETKYLHRILIVAILLSLPFGAIGARLYHLQIVQYEHYRERVQRYMVKTIKITPLRGTLFSRSGNPLATSSFRESVYLAPRYIREEAAARQLDEAMFQRQVALEIAAALSLPLETVERRMNQRGDVVLKRKLSDAEVLRMIDVREEFYLPGPALYFVQEGTRLYPQGELAAHVIGFTHSDSYGDNIGVEGAESAFNDQIKGAFEEEKVETRAAGLVQPPIAEEAFLRASGNDVYLTLDEAIQYYAESALAKQVEQFRARGGVCVVMEVGTGAVLAMASYPTFDSNAPGSYPAENRRNRCLVDSIEPGSVMKVFTAAALIEHNLLSPRELIDCENGYKVFVEGRLRRPIRDSHRLGVVTVRETFTESSNVGFVKLGLRLEKDLFYEQLRRFGFGRRTGLDLPGEGSGILRPLDRWDASSRISLPIGYEITLTPIQVAAAMAAIANQGEYIRPRILREIRSPKGELLYRAAPESLGRVCSPQTSRIVLDMMEGVVLEGTGKSAALPGYRIGGKTGTTRKHFGSVDDPDETAYYASFLSVLPVEAPRLVIYSWIDEPKGAKYGGTVAAPVCRAVAEHATRVLGIPPSARVPSNAPPEEKDPPAERPLFPAHVASPLTPALPPGSNPEARIMPDLAGLTMREAVEKLHALDIVADLAGSGVVARQYPPANMQIPPQTRGMVVFEMGE